MFDIVDPEECFMPVTDHFILLHVTVDFALLYSRFFFFFNDTATTEIYTLSLHDALPICWCSTSRRLRSPLGRQWCFTRIDRKSTRLNSSHQIISYAVFCLKKKKRFSVSA